jgi:hypothetical protein
MLNQEISKLPLQLNLLNMEFNMKPAHQKLKLNDFNQYLEKLLPKNEGQKAGRWENIKGKVQFSDDPISRKQNRNDIGSNQYGT